MAHFWSFIFFLLLIVQHGLSEISSGYVTQTVYGFLDFTTTIENTVMVFSPQSAPPLDLQGKIKLPINTIATNPVTNINSVFKIKPTKSTHTSKMIKVDRTEDTKSKTISSKAVVKSDFQETVKETPQKPEKHSVDSPDSILQIEPEYDLLSRQPVEYAEETYRIVNLKSKIRHHEINRARNTVKSIGDVIGSQNRAGLVSKLSGNDLKDGITTSLGSSTHTSVKYAQIMQSSSGMYKKEKLKIQPTSSLRILKTVAPLLPKSNTNLKTADDQFAVTNSKYNKKIASTMENTSFVIDKSKTESTIAPGRSRKTSRNKSKRRNKSSRTSINKSSHQSSTNAPEINNRRSFRPKIQSSIVESDPSSNLYTFKLTRSPGRWQYKTSPKPRVTIRKPVNDNTSFLNSTSVNENAMQNTVQIDLESSGSQNGAIINNVDNENSLKMLIETLNIEISTPENGKETYYEIITIKTPHAFQAGVLKKTRYITVTSTLKKHFIMEPTTMLPDGEPLAQNILATSSNDGDVLHLDNSIVTLNAVFLTNNGNTPELETVTETFNITNIKLKTHILPIVNANESFTNYITLVQTYDYTSLIKVTKTILPLNDNLFVPSLHFKDFSGNLDEAGSEINLELEFGDEDNIEKLPNKKHNSEEVIGNVDVNAPLDKHSLNHQLNPEQVKHLALLNILNPTAHLSTIISTSRPVIRLETIWESHIVPIVNGISTSYRTLSKSIGAIDKTEYEVDTTTVQLPHAVPPLSVNPFLLPVHQFQTVTSPIIYNSVATTTNSKVLKLTFGAKTAYTTIYSTEVIPTAVTTFVTTSIPVQQTAPFPGYFPSPYAPFGYLG